MVLFNYSTKELTAKVVYYGPGLGGKTTNLQWIHEKLPIKNKGKMLSLATETDRTLFFDFLPIELGTIRGMKTRIQLYTVPGQVFYNATRRMVLKGADCVVFVCDSQEPVLEANLESMENMRQNLEANEIDSAELPMVLQYNKRDLPNALPIEILNERLNPRALPFFEAIAVKGIGVEETLKGVTGLVFRSLAAKYGGSETAAAAGPATQPAAVSPPPAASSASPSPPARPTAFPQTFEPPARVPEPPRAALRESSPLPPLNIDSPDPTADELLDALELQPASETSTSSSEPAGAFLRPVPPSLEEEIETLDVDEVLALPSRSVSPPAPAKPSLTGARITLISGPKEAEDLRQRITATDVTELNLEELDEDDEDEPIEELAFEPQIAPPPAPASTSAPERSQTLPPGARPTARPESGITTTAPVAVQVSSASGQTDVIIPVEVTVGSGTTQVQIHLRLTLNLKLPE